MVELLHRMIETVDSYYIWSMFMAFPRLLSSSTILFWLFTYMFLRFQFPYLALYATYFINRRWFEPPPYKRYAGNEPLMSFLIAGRNPGNSVVTCIESILRSNYKNIEIIFADDKSTDDSVELARQFERTARVRVIANANHCGKPANLNLALMFARGEFIFILDADSNVLPDTIDNMLPYFEDPKVGAVSPTIFVRNPSESLLTRCQQLEYVMSYMMSQLWRDRFGMIMTLSGMGTLFRATALRNIGGWDMGLGDDTDSTIRLRKANWKVRTSLRAHLLTAVPVTLKHLVKQRERWTRNMVKQRVRKHRDLGSFRFGFVNGFMWYDQMFNRVVHPFLFVGMPLLFLVIFKSADIPVLFVSLYGYTTIFFALNLLMARDMSRRDPSLRNFWLVPLFSMYRIPLLCVRIVQIARELFMIKTWHPYVPRRIWDSIPHH